MDSIFKDFGIYQQDKIPDDRKNSLKEYFKALEKSSTDEILAAIAFELRAMNTMKGYYD